MGLSSKLAACACLGTLFLAPAVAAGAGRASGMAHPVAPHVLRVGPGADRLAGRRIRGYGYGFGGGYASPGVTSYALEGTGGGAPAYAAPEPPPIPPMPACPMIIKVGPGLEHPVRTQVIYGRPACD